MYDFTIVKGSSFINVIGFFYYRSVAEEQRTLALGMQSVSFRVVGSIPGPVLFGAIFDSACIYWKYDCGHRGNCWVYNNVHLSQRAVIMGMLGIGLNLFFSFITWMVYPKKTASEKKSLQPSTMSQMLRGNYDVDSNSPIKLEEEETV